jgi:hypothetical protein
MPNLDSVNLCTRVTAGGGRDVGGKLRCQPFRTDDGPRRTGQVLARAGLSLALLPPSIVPEVTQSDTLQCVFYYCCRTYYKAVRAGREAGRVAREDMCSGYERLGRRAEACVD